jgi:hypothetical protein
LGATRPQASIGVCGHRVVSPRKTLISTHQARSPGSFLVRLGLSFSEASWAVGQQDLLCVTSHSVNISSAGCDSLSTAKPSYSAVRCPNSLPNSYVIPRGCVKVLTSGARERDSIWKSGHSRYS